MRRGTFAFLGVICLIVVANSCRAEGTQNAAQVEPEDVRLLMAPLEGATEIQRGSDDVVYRLEAAFPARQALETLSKRLSDNGWRALETDILNPGIPTSNKGGWTNFVDGRTTPERRVYQWFGEWANRRGDVVMLVLVYRADSAELGAQPPPSKQISEKRLRSETLKQRGLVVPEVRSSPIDR